MSPSLIPVPASRDSRRSSRSANPGVGGSNGNGSGGGAGGDEAPPGCEPPTPSRPVFPLAGGPFALPQASYTPDGLSGLHLPTAPMSSGGGGSTPIPPGVQGGGSAFEGTGNLRGNFGGALDVLSPTPAMRAANSLTANSGASGGGSGRGGATVFGGAHNTAIVFGGVDMSDARPEDFTAEAALSEFFERRERAHSEKGLSVAAASSDALRPQLHLGGLAPSSPAGGGLTAGGFGELPSRQPNDPATPAATPPEVPAEASQSAGGSVPRSSNSRSSGGRAGSGRSRLNTPPGQGGQPPPPGRKPISMKEWQSAREQAENGNGPTDIRHASPRLPSRRPETPPAASASSSSSASNAGGSASKNATPGRAKTAGGPMHQPSKRGTPGTGAKASGGRAATGASGVKSRNGSRPASPRERSPRDAPVDVTDHFLDAENVLDPFAPSYKVGFDNPSPRPAFMTPSDFVTERDAPPHDPPLHPLHPSHLDDAVAASLSATMQAPVLAAAAASPTPPPVTNGAANGGAANGAANGGAKSPPLVGGASAAAVTPPSNERRPSNEAPPPDEDSNPFATRVKVAAEPADERAEGVVLDYTQLVWSDQGRVLPMGVNAAKLEAHLSEAQFVEVLGHRRADFYTLSKVEQMRIKQDVGLF